MNIYFYILLGIFLYFIFTRILENYNFSVDIENFDPSLVPVSSIIQLAKYFQKIKDGNTTLVKPSNLQIGFNSPTQGNLRVTGNTTIGSATNGPYALNIYGDGYISNNLYLNNQSGSPLPNLIASSYNAFNIKGINDSFVFGWPGKDVMTINKDSNLLLDNNAIVNGITIPSWSGSSLTINNAGNIPLTSKYNNQVLFGDGTGKGVSFQSNTNNTSTDPHVTFTDNGTIIATTNISANTMKVNSLNFTVRPNPSFLGFKTPSSTTFDLETKLKKYMAGIYNFQP